MLSCFCQLCGMRIDGQPRIHRHPHWEPDLSLKVCARCEQDKPHCTVCGLPLASASPNGVCQTCNQVERYCYTCGQLLKQKYVQFNGVGHYCEDCYKRRSACDVCTAPLTDTYWRLSDGRLTCAYCHASAVNDPSAATALYSEMMVVLHRSLGMSLNIPTGLALVDRIQLSEIILQQYDRNGKQAPGTDKLKPEHTLGLYARRGIRRGIYIQTGLPRMVFLQVAAHEIAHAWQGENCPVLHDQDLLVHEGFAEWVAYRVLGDYGYIRAQEQMQARTDIYGQGLKYLLDLEANQGIEGVYRVCRAVH